MGVSNWVNSIFPGLGGVAKKGVDAVIPAPPNMPDLPQIPGAPPPPPSFGQANISTAAMEARKRASSLAGASTVATSPSGISTPADTAKKVLGG